MSRKMKPGKTYPILAFGEHTHATVRPCGKWVHVTLEDFGLMVKVNPRAVRTGGFSAGNYPDVAAELGVQYLESLPLKRLIPHLRDRALLPGRGMSSEGALWVCRKAGKDVPGEGVERAVIALRIAGSIILPDPAPMSIGYHVKDSA